MSALSDDQVLPFEVQPVAVESRRRRGSRPPRAQRPVPPPPVDDPRPDPGPEADPRTPEEKAAAERRAGYRKDPEKLLEGLNPVQREAVVHEGSPLLIVAGAGSGKTRVLTRRIAFLLAAREVHPGAILAITFTNKAATEMRERVEDLVGNRARIMWVSTFHSACVRILRREIHRFGLRSSFSIYDQADAQRLMGQVVRDLDLDPRRYNPRAFSAQVSTLKNDLVDHETFAQRATPGMEETLAQAYALYQDRLGQASALDFDDLIMTTVHLLQAFPEAAEHYRRRFRHVLVDEYQDTNHAQYVLVRELVGAPDPGSPVESGEATVEPGELVVVGDADQSIYAFRGATIRNIEQFAEDYPTARVILLEQNYRSTQTILDAANAVIAKNPGRVPKNLWTDAPPGEPVVGWVADDEHGEAQFVVDEIHRLRTTTEVLPSDVAVFYRTNAQSRVFEEVFIRAGLPYKVVGGVRFYERREVRDALAYLRVVANPDDSVSLRRILNTPRRGIGDRAEAAIEAAAARNRTTFWTELRRAADVPGLAARSVTAIEGFVDMLDEVATRAEDGARPAGVLDDIMARSRYMAELQASSDPQDETRLDNLRELLAVAREFEEEQPAGTLDDFLERVSLVADSDQIPDADAGGGVVTLMTLHTAKGLEFPVVFLSGLEDSVFPHIRALSEPGELAEERRLAYVGLTRARQRLYLTRALVRSAFGAPQHNPASRFLADVPPHLVDWRRTDADAGDWRDAAARGGSRRAALFGGANRLLRDVPSLEPGDRVTHDAFGLGRVVATIGAGAMAQATIDFGSAGVKTLLLQYAPVEKL